MPRNRGLKPVRGKTTPVTRQPRRPARSKKTATRRPQTGEEIEALFAKQEHSFTAWNIAEPELLFRDGKTSIDPKSGILQFGPIAVGELAQTREIRVGLIGAADDLDNARRWLDRCKTPIATAATPEDLTASTLPFPGTASTPGFMARVEAPDALVERLTPAEIALYSKSPDRDAAVEALVQAVHRRLEVLTERNPPPQVVLVVLPADLRKALGSGRKRQGRAELASVVAAATPQATVAEEQPRPKVSRTLHRAIKAEGMRFNVPTQVAWSSTFVGGSGVQDEATRAWNFFTALYYKAEHMPWRVAGLRTDTCYVGISFYQPMGDIGRMQTSMAQAFTDRGEGIVLRGVPFAWDLRSQGSPHLSLEAARSLISAVIDHYALHHGAPPGRIVVHKSSVYSEDESRGMAEAMLGRVAHYDLVSLAPSDIRFLRVGEHPPMRGTAIQLAPGRCILYTRGYVPFLGKYPGARIPCPLEIQVCEGSSGTAEVLREVMALTRMNWNSADFASSHPITLGFSRKIGLILSELPPDVLPQRHFRFYM